MLEDVRNGRLIPLVVSGVSQSLKPGLQAAIVVTTNYDDVLQWAHPEPELRIITNRQAAELARLYRDADRARPVVWHLHGHIRDADSLILAPGQYETFYTQAAERRGEFRAALQQLHNAVANYTFLFVGFGMSAPYVMGLPGEVLDSFGGNLEASFALLRRGERDAERLWAEQRVRVLELPEYGQSVMDLLHEIAAQAAAFSPSGAVGPPAPAAPRRVLIPQSYLDWLQARFGQVLAGARIAAGISAPLIGSVVELDPLIAAETVPSVDTGPALAGAHAARDELAAWRRELLALAAKSLTAIGSAETDACAELTATPGQLGDELRAAREDADSQLAVWLAEAAAQLDAARAAAEAARQKGLAAARGQRDFDRAALAEQLARTGGAPMYAKYAASPTFNGAAAVWPRK